MAGGGSNGVALPGDVMKADESIALCSCMDLVLLARARACVRRSGAKLGSTAQNRRLRIQPDGLEVLVEISCRSSGDYCRHKRTVAEYTSVGPKSNLSCCCDECFASLLILAQGISDLWSQSAFGPARDTALEKSSRLLLANNEYSLKTEITSNCNLRVLSHGDSLDFLLPDCML